MDADDWSFLASELAIRANQTRDNSAFAVLATLAQVALKMSERMKQREREPNPHV